MACYIYIWWCVPGFFFSFAFGFPPPFLTVWDTRLWSPWRRKIPTYRRPLPLSPLLVRCHSYYSRVGGSVGWSIPSLHCSPILTKYIYMYIYRVPQWMPNSNDWRKSQERRNFSVVFHEINLWHWNLKTAGYFLILSGTWNLCFFSTCNLSHC